MDEVAQGTTGADDARTPALGAGGRLARRRGPAPRRTHRGAGGLRGGDLGRDPGSRRAPRGRARRAGRGAGGPGRDPVPDPRRLGPAPTSAILCAGAATVAVHPDGGPSRGRPHVVDGSRRRRRRGRGPRPGGEAARGAGRHPERPQGRAARRRLPRPPGDDVRGAARPGRGRCSPATPRPSAGASTRWTPRHSPPCSPPAARRARRRRAAHARRLGRRGRAPPRARPGDGLRRLAAPLTEPARTAPRRPAGPRLRDGRRPAAARPPGPPAPTCRPRGRPGNLPA